MMVQLPDGNWVNPRYVTCVELGYSDVTKACTDTHLWVVANSGYGTKRFCFQGDRRDEIVAITNGDVGGSSPYPQGD